MKIIKVLMLDYSGVTGRWFKDIQIKNICRIYGVDVEFAGELYEDNGSYCLYEEGKITFKELHEILCRKSGRKLSYEKMLETLEGVYEDNDEFVSLLKDIKQKSNLKLVLAQDTGNEDLEWQKKNLESTKLFDHVFTAAKAKSYKKYPEYFQKCLKELNMNSEEIIFFDDKEENVESAKKAGIRGILFSDIGTFKNIIKNELNIA